MRTFLVAYDFSACADAAAQNALDDLLDSRRGGRLLLVHAFETVLPPGAPWSASTTSFEAQTRAVQTQRLELIAERMRNEQRRRCDGNAPIEIEVAACAGDAADVIVAEAEARNVDRIVVGTHGRKGVSYLLLGSVAERVVRRARVPVLVAHAARADDDVDANTLDASHAGG